MAKTLFTLSVILLLIPFILQAQISSVVFFDGKELNETWQWITWGLTENPAPLALGNGYTPGSNAVWWSGSSGDTWQGVYFGFDANKDFSGILNPDSSLSDTLHFKVKAPNTIDTLQVDLRDINGQRLTYYFDDFIYSKLDGEWQQIDLPLEKFFINWDSFDTLQVTGMAIENKNANQTVSEEIYFDDVWIGRPDIRVAPVFFNGKNYAPGISFQSWGFSAAADIVEGAGSTEGTNAIVMVTEGSGWAGIALSMLPQNLSYSVTVDTLKFKMKAPAGFTGSNATYTHSVALQDSVGGGYRATVTLDESVISHDGTWQEVKIPLNEMPYTWGIFDWNSVVMFRYDIYLDGSFGSDTLCFDDIWIGDASVDIMPPASVPSVNVTPDNYINYVTWEDVPGEFGETYDIYASHSPITNLDDPGVTKIGSGIEENVRIFAQYIFHPEKDGEVTFYYAVQCTDGSGNVSESFTATETGTTNTGKGRGVIALGAPSGFVADGNLSEWEGIVPITLKPSENTIYQGTSFDNDEDYSAECYLAIDDDYLYIAFDAIDDIFIWSPENDHSSWWDTEYFEFHFGLYDLTTPHTGKKRGEEPDYKLAFLPDIIIDNTAGQDTFYVNGTSNYYFEDLGAQDYILEAKISLDTLRQPTDVRFYPTDGTVIPLDIFIGDSDTEDGVNDGRLKLAPGDNVQPSWSPEYWTYTWIKTPTTAIDDNDNVVYSYELKDNYPNPFNPATTIEYSIAKSGLVHLDVYDILGRKVETLVNEVQAPNRYSIKYDGHKLSSGVYFYRIQTGDFVEIKKMMLLK